MSQYPDHQSEEHISSVLGVFDTEQMLDDLALKNRGRQPEDAFKGIRKKGREESNIIVAAAIIPVAFVLVFWAIGLVFDWPQKLLFLLVFFWCVYLFCSKAVGAKHKFKEWTEPYIINRMALAFLPGLYAGVSFKLATYLIGENLISYGVLLLTFSAGYKMLQNEFRRGRLTVGVASENRSQKILHYGFVVMMPLVVHEFGQS